ncbi:CvpA family protein [Oleiagrimonas sp. C23AA]|uniref:CvpA family protein n=1 Tax=Oleiagrimonas sp. C23AA TaxID=2719047 RepID=UPI00141FB514|nr:CvpA family protein [Oleiagrimonas sp. C23AA]NII09105.1 CvpA family protein [Oleiagrimonas sp. C23AA]
MNWADYTILAILAVSVLMGLWRGFVAEVLALLIWIAAFWVAWSFGDRVARFFDGLISLPSARMLVGYGLCFLGVLLLGALLRFVMARLIEGTGLTGSDRMLGMLFGLARGALVVTLAVFLLGFTPVTRDPWWHQSQLMPTFEGAAGWLSDRLPDTVRRYLHPVTEAAARLPASLPLRQGTPDTMYAPAAGASSPAPARPATTNSQ